MSPKKIKKTKNYARPSTSTALSPILSQDEVKNSAVLLDFDKISMQPIKSDKYSHKMQSQMLSLTSESDQSYYVDFETITSKRKYLTVIRAAFVFFSIHDKNDGMIKISLKNSSYKEPSKQIEFEASNSLSVMWGFLASMNHSIAVEDKDLLYLSIEITNSSVENVIIGELYILWEFEETDIPMMSFDVSPITFIYDKLKPTDLKELAKTAWTTFEKVAKGKEKARNLRNIFSEKFMSPTVTSNLTIDPTNVKPSILDLENVAKDHESGNKDDKIANIDREIW